MTLILIFFQDPTIKEEIKEEPSDESENRKPKPAKGKKKTKTAPNRRRSRLNSNASSAADVVSSADESSTPHPPAGAGSVPGGALSTPTTPLGWSNDGAGSGSLSSTPLGSHAMKAFRFPKTKKVRIACGF